MLLNLSSLHSAGKDAQFRGEPIRCPKCGGDYVHIGTVMVHQDRNRQTVTRHHVIHEDAAESSGRGSTVTIAFWGECGHAWAYSWHFNKGQTFAVTTELDPDQHRSTLWRD